MRKAMQAGFTLIELVVVIVVLGILAAIAVPQFVDVSGQARTAVAQSACGAVQSQAVLFFASNQAATTAATIQTAVNNSSSGVEVNHTGGCSFTANVPTNAAPVLSLACTPAVPTPALCTP